MTAPPRSVKVALFLAGLVQICQSLSSIEGEDGTSIVPERFLPPRHFNYHPYTDVPIGNYNGYERQGRERSDCLSSNCKVQPMRNTGAVLFSPKPTEYAATRTYESKRDEHIPKKYMFHYVVHDAGGSGDDFSHAQMHDSGATMGEYRVRLPDGRLQVVKYTADSDGYKAKVVYHDDGEKAIAHHPWTPAAHPLETYTTSHIANNQVYYIPQHLQTNQPSYTQGHSPDGLTAFLYLYQDGRPIQ